MLAANVQYVLLHATEIFAPPFFFKAELADTSDWSVMSQQEKNFQVTVASSHEASTPNPPSRHREPAYLQ